MKLFFNNFYHSQILGKRLCCPHCTLGPTCFTNENSSTFNLPPLKYFVFSFPLCCPPSLLCFHHALHKRRVPSDVASAASHQLATTQAEPVQAGHLGGAMLTLFASWFLCTHPRVNSLCSLTSKPKHRMERAIHRTLAHLFVGQNTNPMR